MESCVLFVIAPFFLIVPAKTHPDKKKKEMQRGIRKSGGGQRTESKVEMSGCFPLDSQKMPLKEKGMS